MAKIYCDSADYKIIDQIKNFGKSYKSLTINTVKNFLVDSKKSRFKI